MKLSISRKLNVFNEIENIMLFMYVTLAVSFYGAVGATWIPKVFGFAFAGFFFLNVVLNRKKVGAKIPSFIFILLSVLFCSFYLPYDYGGMDFFFSLIQVYLLAIIVLNIIRYRGKLTTIASALVMGCLVLIFARFQQTGSLIDITARRFEGQAGNPNDYSFILMMALLFILFVLISQSLHIIWNVILMMLMVPLIVELMIYGGSRTAIIALSLGLIIFTSAKFLQSGIFVKTIIGIVVFGLLVRLGTILPELFIFQRFTKAAKTLQGEGLYDKSANDRFEIVLESLRLWAERPLFGNGTNSVRNINEIARGSYAHNNYAEILANNGLIGFLLFYTPHLMILYFVNSSWKNKPRGLWWLNVIVFGLLLSDVGMVNYYNKIYLCILAACLGYAMYHRIQSSGRSQLIANDVLV